MIDFTEEFRISKRVHMFVKNCWYVVAWDYELPEKTPIARKVANQSIVLYRAGKEVIALEDRCPHRAAPLSKGRIEGSEIRCMYHGLKFDKSGHCTEVPGQSAVPQQARARRFAAVERYSWIWVWLGEPANADLELIPRAIGLDDPKWALDSGSIDYKAHYELVNDNLTDFTHVSYVHAKSFGATEEFARTRPHIEQLERGVRIWRWLLEGFDSDTFAETRGSIEQFESFEIYDYLVPGILLMHTMLCPKGTADRWGQKVPDLDKVEKISERFSCQAATPMTDRSTRYFFSSGLPRELSEKFGGDERFERAKLAFVEDREIIEAQQIVIDEDPDRPTVLTSADLASTKIRSLIKGLISRETR